MVLIGFPRRMQSRTFVLSVIETARGKARTSRVLLTFTKLLSRFPEKALNRNHISHSLSGKISWNQSIMCQRVAWRRFGDRRHLRVASPHSET